MSFEVYRNNCKGGDYHCGCQTGQQVRKVRTLAPGTSGDVVTYLTVHLNDGVLVSYAELDKVIDDGYAQAGQLMPSSQYHWDTSTGFVELLFETGFAGSAADAKTIIHAVVKETHVTGQTVTLP
jgi:hypothetical protein